MVEPTLVQRSSASNDIYSTLSTKSMAHRHHHMAGVPSWTAKLEHINPCPFNRCAIATMWSSAIQTALNGLPVGMSYVTRGGVPHNLDSWTEQRHTHLSLEHKKINTRQFSHFSHHGSIGVPTNAVANIGLAQYWKIHAPCTKTLCRTTARLPGFGTRTHLKSGHWLCGLMWVNSLTWKDAWKTLTFIKMGIWNFDL